MIFHSLMNKILIISSLLNLDLRVVKAAFYMWPAWLLDMMTQFTQLGCGGEGCCDLLTYLLLVAKFGIKPLSPPPPTRL